MEQNIERIYENYSKIVYNFLFCLCHNEFLAEELTQETFYHAMKNIDNFRNECKMEVWLCQIAKNLWFKELKRIKKATVISLEAEIGEIKSSLDIESDFIESEQIAEIYKEIEKLDSPDKELMYMRLTTELKFKNIAEILGKSESWARVTFYRCKENLKRKLRKE